MGATELTRTTEKEPSSTYAHVHEICASTLLQGRSMHRNAKFIRVIIGRHLTWSKHVDILKQNFDCINSVLRSISGTSWSKSPQSLLQIRRALVHQTLADTFPVLLAISSTLETSFHQVARSIRVCLGVPCATSKGLLFAEAREPLTSVLSEQERPRPILRLRTSHGSHPLPGLLL